MVNFAVDDVIPAGDALPTQAISDLHEDAMFIGGDPAARVLEPNGVHPLLSAVGRAFAEHRPLVLSPDAVWLTITQNVAHHIRMHARQSRSDLVRHTGRKTLTVRIDGPMPIDRESWRQAVASFRKMLAAESYSSDLFECDFSTSTEVERIAGQIVALDAYSPYFAYRMVAICGIPTITLTGTVEDWQKIRDRIDVIAGLGLEKWCRSLAPIADQFVRAAGGDVDTAFWQRIYNPADAYGGDVITGWAARLYPYLRDEGTLDWPNPLLDLPIDEPRDITVGDGWDYQGPGICSHHVPATLARVRVDVEDHFAQRNRAIMLHAGLIGVAQDDDGALRPIAGWHLTEATLEIDDVIDRIIRDHTSTPRQPEDHRPRGEQVCADVVALYRRIASATLFGGTWHILPTTAHRHALTENETILAIIDLADGRSICAAQAFTFGAHPTYWIACRLEKIENPESLPLLAAHRLTEDPSDIPVYGTSLTQLLAAAMDSNGDITHLETGRLGWPPNSIHFLTNG